MLSSFSGRIHAALNHTWNAEDLCQRTQHWATLLSSHATENTHSTSIGILADNCPDWIAIDLAANQTNITMVPLPTFFSQSQLQHVIQTAQIGILITDTPERVETLGFSRLGDKATHNLHIMLRPLNHASAVPKKDSKITFTSGTTGQPKAVCLSSEQQLQVAQALKTVTESLSIQTHLCLLPFSVLLENVAGVYAAMLSNATIVCPPLDEVGLTGASKFNAQKCIDSIARHQAESIILLPHMLYALLQICEVNDSRTKSLKFIAVGGGKVPINLLQQAREKNLPVFEGYGLSECASVVCLNTPDHQCIGTVGKPLPHVEIRVDEHNEIWVRGKEYTKKTSQWIATGDLGTLSPEGFLHILGRKKNQIITSFGRNISPEWPEDLLLSSGQFLQAAVFGEALPHLSAVLVPTLPLTLETAQAIISSINQQLPDYARIHRFVIAAEPFQLDNGLSTANGRLKREAIFERYLSGTTQQGDMQ